MNNNKQTDRTVLRDPIESLSDAFDAVLILLPDEVSTELAEALADLTVAIVAIESLKISNKN